MYFSDSCNNRIRKITVSTGIISTIAGTGSATYSGDGGPATSATLSYPHIVVLDSDDNLYVADRNNNVIRKITQSTGVISTIAGTGISGYSGDGGPATSATLNLPHGLALDAAGTNFFSLLFLILNNVYII